MRRCASQWTRSCLGQAAPGFATCLSHAGEKSSFATFRKSWNSRSEMRARSASNWGVQSNVKLCRPLLLPDLVHGRQEIVDVASNAEPRCRDVFVHRQFARLPALRPEPCLVGRHGNVGAQFNLRRRRRFQSGMTHGNVRSAKKRGRPPGRPFAPSPCLFPSPFGGGLWRGSSLSSWLTGSRYTPRSCRRR